MLPKLHLLYPCLNYGPFTKILLWTISQTFLSTKQASSMDVNICPFSLPLQVTDRPIKSVVVSFHTPSMTAFPQILNDNLLNSEILHISLLYPFTLIIPSLHILCCLSARRHANIDGWNQRTVTCRDGAPPGVANSRTYLAESSGCTTSTDRFSAGILRENCAFRSKTEQSVECRNVVWGSKGMDRGGRWRKDTVWS